MLVEYSDASIIVQAFKTTLIFFAALPFMPGVLFVAGLFWAYRLIAIFVVWLFMPYLVSIVSPRDTLFAVETAKRSNNQVAVVPGVLVINGNIDVEQVRDWFLSHVIFVRKPTGSLKYPKLRQIQKKFLGFLWWKWDSAFDISCHIREYSADAVIHDLQTILTKFSNDPLSTQKPAWDITVIKNYRNSTLSKDQSQTVVFCRISHTYCDGHSLLRLMTSHFKLESETSYIPNPYCTHNQSITENIDTQTLRRSSNDRNEGYTLSEKTIFFIYLCISFPQYFISVIRSSLGQKKDKVVTHWSRKTKAEITQQTFFTATESFTATKVEETQRRLGVSLQTLMISAIARGYSQSKLANSQSQKHGLKISANFPWKTNVDDDTLCNNWMEAFYNISFKECSNLKQIQNSVAFLSFSPLMASNYYFTFLFNIFPMWILKRISTYQNSHVNMSSVNGPTKKMSISDYALDDFILCCSVPHSNSGIGATVFSYNATTRIILSANISQDGISILELQDLCNNINVGLKSLFTPTPTSG